MKSCIMAAFSEYEEKSDIMNADKILNEKLNNIQNYFDEVRCRMLSGMYTEDYLTAMTMVIRTDKYNISVGPEMKRRTAPYFRVYDNGKIEASKRTARLHFKDNGIEVRNNDPLRKKTWIPSEKVIKDIREILVMPAPALDGSYTVWQELCYVWNWINCLFPFDLTMKEYVSGKYDHKHDGDRALSLAYVPSSTKIPDTWYHTLSGKNKRGKIT